MIYANVFQNKHSLIIVTDEQFEQSMVMLNEDILQYVLVLNEVVQRKHREHTLVNHIVYLQTIWQ